MYFPCKAGLPPALPADTGKGLLPPFTEEAAEARGIAGRPDESHQLKWGPRSWFRCCHPQCELVWVGGGRGADWATPPSQTPPGWGRPCSALCVVGNSDSL